MAAVPDDGEDVSNFIMGTYVEDYGVSHWREALLNNEKCARRDIGIDYVIRLPFE